MSEVIYAINVAELSYTGLKILDVKIGRTTNIRSTLRQYRRSHREAEVLDLWEANSLKTLAECERGVHQVAERYAYQRRGEKFIFLQEGYSKFSENIRLLLKTISEDEAIGSRSAFRGSSRKKTKRIKYTGKKPVSVRFIDKTYTVKNWRDVLRNIATQIYQEKKDFSPALNIRGKKRIYFSKNKDKLKQAKELENTPYFFEGNISANQAMSVIDKLLEVFGYEKSNLHVDYK